MMICISCVSQSKGLSALITNSIADLHFIGDTQLFPLYWYEESKTRQLSLFDENPESEYIRHDGISNWILNEVRTRLKLKSIDKEMIFYYIYGFLHSPEYRTMFEADLKKSLPRIPIIEDVDAFRDFYQAGKALAKLHLNYECVAAYDGLEIVDTYHGKNQYEHYAVNPKMKFPKKDQKDTIIYNDYITIRNIPAEAYDYVVNGKSAIEWLMERYAVTVDKKSGIRNDPNDWSREHENPSYIFDLVCSIVNVSIKTMQIVGKLPKLSFNGAEVSIDVAGRMSEISDSTKRELAIKELESPMPLFSIIIPVYNVQNYLSACVKSVVEQPGPRDWECILVDDGSTDQSGAMCDALAAELPGLQVIHRENGGLAAARNTGLKAATGDWLLFLDSDDAMAPGLLAQLRGALAAHPDCDWFIGKHLEWQPDGTLTPHDGLHLVPGPFASSDYAARLKALYTAGHWSVWKYCIRRSFLEQARVRFLPDCVWAEDWPFDLELLLHCDRLYFLDTVFTHYRVGRQGSLLTDAKNLPKRFRGLAAAQRRLARLSANGTADAAAYAAMQDAAADVFWPQARTAAVRDAAIRKACLPYIEQLRPLYPHGTEVRTRRDWRLFQWMMQTFGPKFTLWAASRR